MGCIECQEKDNADSKESDYLNSERITNIKSSVPSWANDSDDCFTFKRFTGITNVTGYVENSRKDVTPKRVIYREFGDGASDFINRDDEIKVFKRLGDIKFGPKTLGGTKSYRVEEYYYGRACNVEDLKDPVVSRKIFARLAEFHSLKMDFVP